MYTKLLFLPLCLCLANTLEGQTGNISGTVTESTTNSVLAGAQVALEGRPIQTATNPSGHYLLQGIPAGTVKVTVSYIGMAPTTREIPVSAGETTAVDFAL
jgi:carboxypeptidase family protein